MPQTVFVGPRQVPRRASPGRAGAPAIPPGHVQLYCAAPPRNLVLPLGPEPVKLAAGGGGWELLPLPERVAATIRSGLDPFALQLPLLLDNFARRTSVERAMRALDRIARGDAEGQPPGVVEVGGVPLPADEWVIEALDYGDPVRAVDGLAVIRQPVTLTLREHVPPHYMQLRRRGYGGGYGHGRRTTGYRAKQGETVSDFARRRKVPWTALRYLNPGLVRRANQKLRAGQIIYAPPPGTKRPPQQADHGVLND